MTKTIADRLEKHSIPEPNSGCVLWLGHVNGNGYGQISVGKRRKLAAHRAAYEHRFGSVPEGHVLDHLCRVRSCINPEHLEAVTTRENILRGISPSALRAKQTHCVHGHPLSGDNLRISALGQRQCRECNRAAVRRYKAKKAA